MTSDPDNIIRMLESEGDHRALSGCSMFGSQSKKTRHITVMHALSTASSGEMHDSKLSIYNRLYKPAYHQTTGCTEHFTRSCSRVPRHCLHCLSGVRRCFIQLHQSVLSLAIAPDCAGLSSLSAYQYGSLTLIPPDEYLWLATARCHLRSNIGNSEGV